MYKTLGELLEDDSCGYKKATGPITKLRSQIFYSLKLKVGDWETAITKFLNKQLQGNSKKVTQEKNNLKNTIIKESLTWDKFMSNIVFMGIKGFVITFNFEWNGEVKYKKKLLEEASIVEVYSKSCATGKEILYVWKMLAYRLELNANALDNLMNRWLRDVDNFSGKKVDDHSTEINNLRKQILSFPKDKGFTWKSFMKALSVIDVKSVKVNMEIFWENDDWDDTVVNTEFNVSNELARLKSSAKED